ncbi:MAG TPA: heparinase II/III family protein [Opitutaceae bacterium]
MKRPIAGLAALLLGAALLTVSASAAAVGAATDDPLEGLKAGHPRLMVASNQVWADLARRAPGDPGLGAVVRRIESTARTLLTEPPAQRVMTGRRLLGVSREVLGRVTALAAAYHLTGNRAFAARAEQEMLAAAAFTDWNPAHFLDVGEMTTALALGYDWLFDELTSAAQVAIRQAIVDKGLKAGLVDNGHNRGWQRAETNWNQVCFGGLTLGALVVADHEPVLARQVLALARERIPLGLRPYAPDGVYPEGPSYWSYGTTYSALTVAALETALGTDWGITSAPGFMAGAGAYAQMIGPTGLAYNFADGGEAAGLQPTLMWFARRINDPGLMSVFSRQLGALIADAGAPPSSDSARFLAIAALWWTDADAVRQTPKLPLAWVGHGANPVAVFRRAWNDPDAAYLALKGGSANLNHAHMDVGSFVYEADGVRWADDLGMQNYESLESKGIALFGRTQDAQRWTVFRLNNRSHNTLTIDDQLHRVEGVAKIRSFSADAADAHAIVDLSPAFAGQAMRVERGFRWLPQGAVLVQDEVRGAKPGANIRWALVTRADVHLSADGRGATLLRGGKRLEVQLVGPASARFAVIPADPPADNFNAPNPGRRILIINHPASASGEADLAVWLKPAAANGSATPTIEPIQRW